MAEKYTAGEWGASESNPEMTGRDPVVMIVTPPKAEVARRIATGKLPVTSRRIALLEPSHYVTLDECRANGRVMAAAKELLAACEAGLAEIAGREHVAACVDDVMTPELRRLQTLAGQLRSAIHKATSPA